MNVNIQKSLNNSINESVDNRLRRTSINVAEIDVPRVSISARSEPRRSFRASETKDTVPKLKFVHLSETVNENKLIPSVPEIVIRRSSSESSSSSSASSDVSTDSDTPTFHSVILVYDEDTESMEEDDNQVKYVTRRSKILYPKSRLRILDLSGESSNTAKSSSSEISQIIRGDKEVIQSVLNVLKKFNYESSLTANDPVVSSLDNSSEVDYKSKKVEIKDETKSESNLSSKEKSTMSQSFEKEKEILIISISTSQSGSSKSDIKDVLKSPLSEDLNRTRKDSNQLEVNHVTDKNELFLQKHDILFHDTHAGSVKSITLKNDVSSDHKKTIRTSKQMKRLTERNRPIGNISSYGVHQIGICDTIFSKSNKKKTNKKSLENITRYLIKSIKEKNINIIAKKKFNRSSRLIKPVKFSLNQVLGSKNLLQEINDWEIKRMKMIKDDITFPYSNLNFFFTDNIPKEILEIKELILDGEIVVLKKCEILNVNDISDAVGRTIIFRDFGLSMLPDSVLVKDAIKLVKLKSQKWRALFVKIIPILPTFFSEIINLKDDDNCLSKMTESNTIQLIKR